MGVPEGREKMPSLPTATARCLAPRPRIAILAPRSPPRAAPLVPPFRRPFHACARTWVARRRLRVGQGAGVIGGVKYAINSTQPR